MWTNDHALLALAPDSGRLSTRTISQNLAVSSINGAESSSFIVPVATGARPNSQANTAPQRRAVSEFQVARVFGAQALAYHGAIHQPSSLTSNNHTDRDEHIPLHDLEVGRDIVDASESSQPPAAGRRQRWSRWAFIALVIAGLGLGVSVLALAAEIMQVYQQWVIASK